MVKDSRKQMEQWSLPTPCPSWAFSFLQTGNKNFPEKYETFLYQRRAEVIKRLRNTYENPPAGELFKHHQR
jgi:hypothetical protein